MAFNLFSNTKSWIDSVKGETENHYDAALDPRATEADVSAREAERIELSSTSDCSEETLNEIAPELSVGDYLTNGRDAFRFETSIGNGKGSTVLSLGARDLAGISDALRAPLVDLDRLSPVECIRRTIARNPGADGEGPSITFKVSLAKHSRTVVVPESSWPEFLSYVSTLADRSGDAIAHFRELTRRSEAAATKAAKPTK
jgi:hypothetical protein